MGNDIKKQIGQNLRSIRKIRGLKQNELAELAGVEDKTISRIEVGGNYPSMALLVKLAQVLDCELTDFVKINDNDPIKSVLNELSETEIATIKKFITLINNKL